MDNKGKKGSTMMAALVLVIGTCMATSPVLTMAADDAATKKAEQEAKKAEADARKAEAVARKEKAEADARKAAQKEINDRKKSSYDK